MIILVARRFALALLTLFIISIFIFLGVEALPGDMATAYLGQAATEESLAAKREEFGLNAPAHERYFDWLGGILRGDLGVSKMRTDSQNADGVPITRVIGNKFRNTVVLAAAAGIVGIPMAVVLGVFAALARDKWPDIVMSMIAIISMTLPGFVTATILRFVFVTRLDWFDPITLVATDASVSELLPTIVLPIVTLTLIMVAHILRLVRTSMIDVMMSDYVQMARLKGVPEWKIVFKHALPNAMLPSINIIALTIGWLLGGVAIIEIVFNYPGIGVLMINAISDRDLFLVQAIALLLAGVYIGVNLIADLLALFLNPKLRTAQGH